jgi:tetratricopeptide (TPR) repeat protein
MWPWLKRYVEQLPEHHLAWQELRKQHQAKPENFSKYLDHLQTLANFCDWSSQFDTGYDMHYRLAATGRLASLDRCVVLQNFLGRAEDLSALLVAIGSVPERPQLQIKLAEMLAEIGDDVGAKPVYENWLSKHPEDKEASFDLACLLEDMISDEQARGLYEKHLLKYPQDVRAVKKLASLHIRHHRLEPALNLYAKLQAKDHDHYTLENYCLVAKSLDVPEHLQRALLLTLQTEKQPHAETYLELSELGSWVKDRTPIIAALEQGQELLPDSSVLRVALAQLYLKNDSQVEGDVHVAMAAKLLMHDGIYHHRESLSELLAISHRVADKQNILAFLGSDIEKKLPLNMDDKLNLAVLAFNCHEEKRGTALIESVPQVLENYPDLAQAHCLIGNYQQAMQLMSDYLNKAPQSNADDWVFLGDLYDLLGQKEQAQAAFEYSLKLLTTDLEGKTPPRRISAVIH